MATLRLMVMGLVLCTGVAIGSLPARSAVAPMWTEYKYLDHGFAIQFPHKPMVSAGTWKSILAKNLKTSIYSAEDDHVVYRMTVVELAGHPDAGGNFANEADYNLMREGDVIFTDFPRVYQNAQSVFGVTLVVDRPDGTRVRSSVYYHKDRLYIAQAIILPARGDKDMTTPARFDQTIRFPPDGRFD
jgi:hypothetical protein